MSDFYLDFREKAKRRAEAARAFLKYFPDIKTFVLEENDFSLVVTRCDDESLWAPYRSMDNKIMVALAGRIALEEKEWDAAKSISGNGGTACKVIYNMYKKEGISGLYRLNGSYIAMVFDAVLKKFFLVSDRCGMFPFYKSQSSQNALVFSSHQDLVSLVDTNSKEYDTTSLGEFLVTGQVSYPYTYYKGISGCEFASVHTVDLSGPTLAYPAPVRYFNLTYKPDYSESKDDFSERLAAAFRNALRRRTHGLLGKSALGLSGGLDSRMILCASPDPSRITAFSFYDEVNLEFKTARAIAKVKGIKMIPLNRDLEYYAASAEAGVKISGGTSNFLANHLLGFRQRLREEGLENILTGLYCDYFFKGLAQNRHIHKFTGNAGPAPFNYEWYLSYIPLHSTAGTKVEERMEKLFPQELRRNSSDLARLEVESKRLFPLCYECENAEVLIPQRVVGWYMPILDNDVLDVYLTMPFSFKFDSLIYEKFVQQICGDKISSIPNSNTGLPVNSSSFRRFLNPSLRYVRNRYYAIKKRIKPQLATPGSWPNWRFFIAHSTVIKELWNRKNSEARDIFENILGFDPFGKAIIEYQEKDDVLFQRLLTLKIWLDLKK